jgi:RND family efflux transporter MFP subunit
MSIAKLLPLLLVASCATSNQPSSPPAAVAPPVAAQPIEKPALVVAGVVVSRDSKLAIAEVDGAVDSVAVEHGKRVVEGDVLVVVNDTEVKRQLDAARGAEEAATGELRRAETARAEAGRVLRQQKSLLRDGAVSRDAVASASSAYAITGAQVQTAGGTVRRARASREQAEQALAKTTITAPMNGVITVLKVASGQMVGRGQAIARVFDPQDLWVRFAIEPAMREKIADGMRVRITAGGKTYEATIRSIGRTYEPPLQLAVVEADLDDAVLADHDAMLGTMVDVRIE